MERKPALEKLGYCSNYSRKEVIQAHLPVHLPCYDFVLVTSPTLDNAFP